MRFDRHECRWLGPDELGCQIGGSQGSQQSSGSGTSSGQSTTTPLNFQNPSFTNQAPNTAAQLGAVGTGAFMGADGISPTTIYGTATNNTAANPLVAPVTGAQNQTLSGIGSLVNGLPSSLSGAFSQLSGEMNPNFASNLATSPQTKAAESAAIQPIQQTFNSQTVPGLQGSFTQAGQRVGQQNGMGSSAFDNSFAAAQGNELSTEASTAGAIANNAYQTGLNIQANAPSQVGSLTSSELGDMVSGLNAQALPQLTQQYGISAGTQLYQSQMATIMQALGLQVQGEQPSLGYEGESTNSSQSSEQGSGSSSSLSLSNPFSIGI